MPSKMISTISHRQIVTLVKIQEVMWKGIGCFGILAAFPLARLGWQSLPPLLGITLIVCSLFGDIPQIAWLKWLGDRLAPGIIVGTIIALIPFLVPQHAAETSLIAFSPSVWGAYLSIIAVGIAFEISPLPLALQRFCQSLSAPPALIIPLYVIIAGLLGNLFDGVSIIAISVVIFLTILPRAWAVEAAFALLFGGLISNLITVAAEPTNIKFQDTLARLLDPMHPPFWFTNWPISVFGIVLPALLLFIRMRGAGVAWYTAAPPEEAVAKRPILASTASEDDQEDQASLPASAAAIDDDTPPQTEDVSHLSALLSALALLLLATGIIAHAVLQARSANTHLHTGESIPLWLLLAPAGIVAMLHIILVKNLPARIVTEPPLAKRTGRHFALAYLREAWPVWGKIMVIFSLIWFVSQTTLAAKNVFGAFFLLNGALRYGMMIILSLLSSITDNVALAAMQGALIVQHPLAIWQIRFLLILLTWSGGLTYFGCLQSLALYSRLKMTPREWFRASLPWATVAIIGGVVGLLLIGLFYPTSR